MFAGFMRFLSRLLLLVHTCLWLLVFAGGSSLFTSCANPAQPMGGPRDSLPPQLVKASPADSTLGFSGQRIELQFDEYITVENPFEQVLINPSLNKFPNIEGKLRSISVVIKDTLKPNTTYSLEFGNAIKDVNEGNILKGFTYVFSTGKTIDTATLVGTILNAETGQPDSTMAIVLHTDADDSAVAKKKPVYSTRPDGKGNFQFRFLPNKTFYLFALKDEGFRQYQSGSTPFAFADSPVLAGQSAPITLRYFVAVPDSADKKKPTTTEDDPGRRKRKTTEGEPASRPKRIRYSFPELQPAQDITAPLVLLFSEPMATLDTTKIRLSDTLFKKPVAIKFQLDSTATRLSIKAPWKGSENYALVLEPGFATDSSGLGIPKNDTIKFIAKSESEYGALRLSFSGLQTSNKPLVLFIQNNAIVRREVLTTNNLRIELMPPGTYSLRIVYDTNGNGKWDTGDYWKKRQPEMVIGIPKELNIRANWDNEYAFEL